MSNPVNTPMPWHADVWQRTQARRRAVKDAAPEAVQRLTDHLARDGRANQEAMQFLRNDGARIAELLARGRAAMGAEATRVFLLIDSAAG